MGQSANNGGRNASLDQQKQRAAGRGTRATDRDWDSPQPGSGRTLGAFGNDSSARAPRKKASKRKPLRA